MESLLIKDYWGGSLSFDPKELQERFSKLHKHPLLQSLQIDEKDLLQNVNSLAKEALKKCNIIRVKRNEL